MVQEETARSVVAHLFQRAGLKRMSESELANALSLDLGWFPPRKARDLVAGLVRSGHLAHDEDGDLRPGFDVDAHRVPLGFRPPAGLPEGLPAPGTGTHRVAAHGDATGAVAAAARQEDPVQVKEEEEEEEEGAGMEEEGGEDEEATLPSLLDGLAKETGEDAGVWVGRMEQVAQRTGDGLAPEAALLVAAAQRGVPVTAHAARLRARLEGARGGDDRPAQ